VTVRHVLTHDDGSTCSWDDEDGGGWTAVVKGKKAGPCPHEDHPHQDHKREKAK
jgi:hypothetical protein